MGERICIHLARAFITNPEVLILHKPLELFDSKMENRLKHLMNAHVDERGLGLTAADRIFRRPRTVFFSSNELVEEDDYDDVWRFEVDEVSGESKVIQKKRR